MSGLRDAWSHDRAALGAWCMLASGSSAEAFATNGYDYVCIDCQHGLIGYESMIAMLQAAARTPASLVVRVPSNDAATIGQALDAGAEAVIVPLVNDADEAARAASACRYPPDGVRSFGPSRAQSAVACIVMIETRAGVDAAETICTTRGLDGVYIGPSDLAISLGVPMAELFRHPEHLAAIEHVRAACEHAGIVAGLHLGSGKDAARWADRGFRMLTVASDLGLLTRGARAELDAAR